MSKPCFVIDRKRKISETEAIHFNDIDSLDATTFLSRVAAEASRLPEVMQAHAVAESEPSNSAQPEIVTGSAASALYLISHRTTLFPVPSAAHLPKSPNWKTLTLTNFQKLRSFLEACRKPAMRLPVPRMRDRGGWHEFCVGINAACGNPGGYFATDDSSVDNDSTGSGPSIEVPEWRKSLPENGYAPTVPLLLQMDQIMIRMVLHHLAFFLNEGFPLSEQRSVWVYSLLARLELPIHQEEAVMLYSLLKRLTVVRKLQQADSPDLAACNTLILLVDDFFEQGNKSALGVFK